MNAFVVMSNGQPVYSGAVMSDVKLKAAKFVRVSRTLWIDTIESPGIIKRWTYDKDKGVWDEGLTFPSRAEVIPAALPKAILVARVTVADKTLVVKAGKVNEALIALHGAPVAGMSVSAKIEFDEMTEAELAALPEYQ